MGLGHLKSSTGLQSKMALWCGCQMGAQLGRSTRMPGQGLPSVAVLGEFDMFHGGWLPPEWHPKRMPGKSQSITFVVFNWVKLL